MTVAALSDLSQELAGTRRMLERVPEDRLDWRPHEKSMTLGGLATHLVNLLWWQRGILEADEYDLSAGPQTREAHTSRAALLEEFDERARDVLEIVEGMDEARLAQPWTLRSRNRVIFSEPRLKAFRQFGVSHMVHHRAQLGVYLRMLGVPVPGMYGRSADEMHG